MAPRKLKSETKKMSKASRDRLHCVMRKGLELTTLCDIEGCIVVFDDNRLITAEAWPKQKNVHQIINKYHTYVEEQRRKELKKAGVKSSGAKSTGRHCDDKPSSNGCVPSVMQPHSGDVSNVNVDSLVLDDMEMQAEEGVSLLSDYRMGTMHDVIPSDCPGYFPGNMGIDNMAGPSEDAENFECLPDIGGLVDMERQLENGISSEFVGHLPEMGFKDMGEQFEDDNFGFLLTNFDFDGIVGQSAFEISSDLVTLPDFASDYSHEECFPEEYNLC